MSKHIGNKDEALPGGKAGKKEIRRINKAREVIRQAIAQACFRNQLKNQPDELALPPA
ncbi:hypothetical protein [Massilia sp. DWR3-1-1]|uniref:hypothetical protein n=1 Tax=Massilia sp. DWR3-1-1 TaxID=2804559 RepID=UPI003CEA5616